MPSNPWVTKILILCLLKKCSSKNLLFVEICVVELIQQRCSSIFNIEPTNQRVRMTSLNQIWDASNLVPLFRPLSLAVSGAIHWQENILFYMSVIIHWKYVWRNWTKYERRGIWFLSSVPTPPSLAVSGVMHCKQLFYVSVIIHWEGITFSNIS